jgi:hypothetical protein
VNTIDASRFAIHDGHELVMTGPPIFQGLGGITDAKLWFYIGLGFLIYKDRNWQLILE